MSLLIKALDKAEKAQEEQSKLIKTNRRRASNIANEEGAEHASELSLQQEGKPEHNLTQEFYAAQYAVSTNEKAASVFQAKQLPAAKVSPLVWVAAIALLALLSIGGYFYHQFNHLQSTPVAVPVSPLSATPTQDTSASDPIPQELVASVEVLAQTEPSISASEQAIVNAPVADASLHKKQPQINDAKKMEDRGATRKSPNTRLALADSEQKIEPRSALSFDSPIASESVSIQIAKAKTAPAVAPELMSAYNAYIAGQDAEAQVLYKKVLQHDMRNVDALLGLAVIAEKQGRLADASGWYQKVLEAEPSNAIARAAIYSAQLQVDENSLSKLKSLVAKEPNNARLHAELGGAYAEQQLWPQAQQAYFEAYRLQPSAENAFNLGVGLDQMGKPRLALPYYQEAMSLSQQQPHHAIDEATLLQRIKALQTQ